MLMFGPVGIMIGVSANRKATPRRIAGRFEALPTHGFDLSGDGKVLATWSPVTVEVWDIDPAKAAEL